MAVTEASAAPVDAVDLYRFFHAADDETVALGGVSLRVERGETVAVVGPSGSGKSTLLACIAGLDDPDGGHVRIAGAPMTRRPERVRAALRARMIGVLFQSGNLFEHLTVAGNVRLAQQLAGRVDATASSNCSMPSDSPTAPRRRLRPCRAGRRPEPASPSRWPTTRRSCWRTSRPARSTN